MTSTSPTSSVSFRIGRHAQDLAETVHALSQRLVSLEQRLLCMEGQLRDVRQQPRQTEESEAASLAPIEAHIERLLQDCRQLLADQPPAGMEEASQPVRQVVGWDGPEESAGSVDPAAGGAAEIVAAEDAGLPCGDDDDVHLEAA
ncbi:MAG: chemotaxis protein [Cyanobium sp.]